MKKCVLVNCFASSNEMRIEPIREVLEEKGYETIYISSDFHHALKEYVELDPLITPIHVKPYKKNLSVDRLLSHREFSKEVYKYLCDVQPELIYIKFPPNTLVKIAYEYKKNHNCKIILDLFDLWPESLPVPVIAKIIGKPALEIWSGYRDKYITCADLLLTECDMYREVLRNKLPANTNTLYLMKEDIDYHFIPAEEGKIKLCYLGGINNLIDFNLLGNVVNDLKGQGEVSIDIIGDGVNRNALIKVFEDRGCKVLFHGIIYDEKKKYAIMSNCDLGLNVAKNNVKVALSIKSIEYFRAGLGVINSVRYDTYKLIEGTKSGINVDQITEFDIRNIDTIKKNSRKLYENIFNIDVNKEKFIKYLMTIGI